jgi:hypothetical protein
MNMSPHDFFRALGIDNPDDAPAVFREYFNLADTDGNHCCHTANILFSAICCRREKPTSEWHFGCLI